MTNPAISSRLFAYKCLKKIGIFVFLGFCQISYAQKPISEQQLLNVSYDVSRELYRDINQSFSEEKLKNGARVEINQSHNASSKQARAIIDGLEADVVTMNQELDLNLLKKAGLIDQNWQTAFPNHSVPYSSTIIFLVRKGNPKNIKDWDDLVRPDVQIMIPNPKTSGNGRWSYLAALAYATQHFKDAPDATLKIKDFIHKMYKNAPILDAGSRAATTSFIQRDIGDVLITFESEILQISKKFGDNAFESVIPSISIDAECPVAVVLPVVERHNTQSLAVEYLNFLYSEQGQKIIAAHYLRPYLKSHSNEKLANIPLISVESLGGFEKLIQIHFADGGWFDEIYQNQ